MRLTSEAFARARAFQLREARPLERALFRFHFEDGGAQDVREALRAFRNDDGGFGNALEPDLRLPASSVLATCHALERLHEVGTPPDDPLLTGAVDWLVGAHDPDLGAWRSVPREAEQHPHAPWWKWALHADGTRWPVAILPGAEVLTHLWRTLDRVPRELLEAATRRFLDDFEANDDAGADALVRCDGFARTEAAPGDAREAAAARLRVVGPRIVSRDPRQWHGYVAKPLKLVPEPACLLADLLAEDVQRNLDYEIAHQQADGAWLPNWTWEGAFPDVWEVARREWCGVLTLETLRSLRAWGRIEVA